MRLNLILEFRQDNHRRPVRQICERRNNHSKLQHIVQREARCTHCLGGEREQFASKQTQDRAVVEKESRSQVTSLNRYFWELWRQARNQFDSVIQSVYAPIPSRLAATLEAVAVDPR